MTDNLPVVIDADTGEAPRFQQGGGIAVRSMDDLARMAGAVANVAKRPEHLDHASGADCRHAEAAEADAHDARIAGIEER